MVRCCQGGCCAHVLMINIYDARDRCRHLLCCCISTVAHCIPPPPPSCWVLMSRKRGAMGRGGGGILALFSSSVDIIAVANWRRRLDTKHGLFSGNAGLRSDVDHDMEGRSCCRQGSICQNRARGIPKTRARSPSLLRSGRWRRLKPRAGDRTTRAGGGAVFSHPRGV